MKIRIKDGALVGQDHRFSTWEDDGTIFEAEVFNDTKYKCVADGYGSKDNYGSGALYVHKEDAYPAYDYTLEALAWREFIWGHTKEETREYVNLPEIEKARWREAARNHIQQLISNGAI